MKKILLALLLTLFSHFVYSQEPLDYFLPTGTSYLPGIPTPQSAFGFQPGEHYLSHDKLVSYLQLLDSKSDRLTILSTGKTYENQPLLLVVITSPDNQLNLEKLRRDHLESIDPKAPQNNVRKDPLIVWLGYSVHGNEASGGNAAPLVAYYLAAAQNDEVRKMLDQTIILLDPCQNPDGFNHFATWVNSKSSQNLNPDALSIEFDEPWPGSRSNHYWFDLNRDWLWIQNPESQARIEQFQRWKPHILTDHHEMGSNSTFFFQPGVPSRSNPLIPASNFSLTQKIGTYHARELDAIGSLYYSEESFDDYYFGKGSAYPDLNGSIGILFEQGGSRGHLVQTQNGILSFAFTIRNQVKVSLSTLKASQELSKELKYNQVEFYKSALAEAEKNPVKGIIFGDAYDPQRSMMMANLLMEHQIKIQKIKKTISLNGTDFYPESAFFIPFDQLQYRVIRAFFDKVTQFADSTFYDVSGWTLPYAMGIPYYEIDEKNFAKIGTDGYITSLVATPGRLNGTESTVGYLFNCNPYFVHKALYELLTEGIRVKISSEPFTTYQNNQLLKCQPGTLFVPVQNQTTDEVKLYQLLNEIAPSYGLEINSVASSLTWVGPDLGSNTFYNLQLPKILTLTGEGTSSREIGQIWHLLDTRFKIPITLADMGQANRIRLTDYNTLILTSGSYNSLNQDFIAQLKDWVRAGGKIIALRSAGSFLNRNGLLDLKPIKSEDENDLKVQKAYADRNKENIGENIPGTIFMTRLDTTHPLAYGYHQADLAVFKTGGGFYELNPNSFENIAVYTQNPLISGFVNQDNLNKLKGSSSIQRQKYGRGAIIFFADDPVFRGYWAGEHKILLNAIFWGGM